MNEAEFTYVHRDTGDWRLPEYKLPVSGGSGTIPNSPTDITTSYGLRLKLQLALALQRNIPHF